MSSPRSRRGESPFPRMFLRGMSLNRPSTSSQEEHSGSPLDPIGAKPMDEDPLNEAFVLSLL
jgi:hypothetical protein